MIEYIATWWALKTDRRAVTALEYGMIAGVLVAVVATIFTTFGADLTTKFTAIGSAL